MFDEAVRRQIRGEIVRCGRLAEFDFKSGWQRFWPGQWPLTIGSGASERVFLPTHGIGQVTGISQSVNGSAPEIKLELSGVDPGFVAKAKGAAEEYFGRKVFISLQFFGDDWQPLGNPIVVAWGKMRSMTSIRRSTEAGVMQSLVLSAESPFDGRARARNSYLTDVDQRARHKGDAICSRVAGIEIKKIDFPVFG